MAIDFKPINESNGIDFVPMSEEPKEDKSIPIDKRGSVIKGLSNMIPGTHYAANYWVGRAMGMGDSDARKYGEEQEAIINRTESQGLSGKLIEGGTSLIGTLPKYKAALKLASYIPGIRAVTNTIPMSGAIKRGVRPIAQGIAGFSGIGATDAITRGASGDEIALDSLMAGATYPIFHGAGKLGATVIPKNVPFAERIGSAVGMGSTMAILAPEGEKISEGLLGAGLGITGPQTRIKGKSPQVYRQEATDLFRRILKPTAGDIKKLEIKQRKDIDESMALAAEEGLPINKSSDNRLDTTEAIKIVNENNREVNQVLEEILKLDTEKRFSLEEIRTRAISGLNEKFKKQKISTEEYDKSIEDVNELIDKDIKYRGSEVTGYDLNGVKKGFWLQGYDQGRPTKYSVSRQLGRYAKEMIEEGYSDSNIKGLNNLSGKYATLEELLSKAHARVVEKGKIGRYTAQGIGAYVGGKILGAPGAALGGWAGGKINDYMVSPKRLSIIASRKARRAKMNKESYKKVMGEVMEDNVIPNFSMDKKSPVEVELEIIDTKQKQIGYRPPTENLGVPVEKDASFIPKIDAQIAEYEKMLPSFQRAGSLEQIADIERRITDLASQKKAILDKDILKKTGEPVKREAQEQPEIIKSKPENKYGETVGIDEETGLPILRKTKQRSDQSPFVEGGENPPSKSGDVKAGGMMAKLSPQEKAQVDKMDIVDMEIIQLDSDVVAKDIFGKTKTYKKGESIYIYRDENSNKALVKDGVPGILQGGQVDKVVSAGVPDGVDAGQPKGGGKPIESSPQPQGEGKVMYHGGGEVFDTNRTPTFFVDNEKDVSWYKTERGGKVHKAEVTINKPATAKDMIRIAKEIGVKIEEQPYFSAPEISKHSPYEGGNPNDLIYIPRVREALKKAGYDGLQDWDVIENTEVRISVPLDKSQIKLSQPQGEGVVAYHGTNAEFETFKPTDHSYKGVPIISFSSNKSIAKTYGKNIKQVSLDMKNPYVVDANGGSWKTHPPTSYVDVAKENGYDGVIVKNIRDGVGNSKHIGDTYIVFNPKQIAKLPQPQGEGVRKSIIEKDISSEIQDISNIIPQSEGAGKIPKIEINDKTSVDDMVKKLTDLISSDPEKYPTIGGSPLVKNADYGWVFQPCPSCRKGETMVKKMVTLRDVLEKSLPETLSKEERNAIKTEAARKLFESGVKQGLETPCPTCYTAEKQIIGYNAKPISKGRQRYREGDMFKRKGLVEQVKESGIIRGYGTGDSVKEDIPSLINLAKDLSTIDSTAGMYLKNLNTLEVLGDIGFKYNVSTAYDIKFGLPIDIAYEYAKRYPNVGLEITTLTDSQTRRALNDDRINNVIPEHLGGGTPVDWMSDIAGMEVKNYNKSQTEKVHIPELNEETGKTRIVKVNLSTAQVKNNDTGQMEDNRLVKKFGKKVIDEIKKNIKNATDKKDAKTYLDVIANAEKILRVKVDPKFPQFKNEKGYYKLIGTGLAEYGKDASKPTIDISKVNLSKAEEYFNRPEQDMTETGKSYDRISKRIVGAARRGGAEAIKRLDARVLMALLGVGIASNKSDDK